MREWKDQTLVNQTFLFSGKKEVNALGLKLVLRHCDLTIRCPSKCLIASGVKFIDCSIDIGGQLKDHPWYHCYLENCRLVGKLVGHDFGRRSDPFWPQEAGVRNCDFSQARMDGCRFFNTEIDEVKLPGWPMFTIIDPIRNGRKMLQEAWPSEMLQSDGISHGIWMQLLTEQPADTSFVIDDAEKKINTYGGNLETFRDKLSSFKFVRS